MPVIFPYDYIQGGLISRNESQISKWINAKELGDLLRILLCSI